MDKILIVVILLTLVMPLSELRSEVNWSGYFDFEYQSKAQNFQQHHLSTFLQYNSKLVTVFSEVEYEYAPSYESSNNGQSTQSSGAFLIETVWADINLREWFKIRLGRHLVPAWWQTFHYPNIVLTVTRPQIIKNIFPEVDTGPMIHGSYAISTVKLNYKSWLGNGGGEVNNSKDNSDKRKSFGLRGEVEHLPFFDYSHIGFMYMDQPTVGTSERSDIWGVDTILEYKGVGINGAYHWTHNLSGYYIVPSYRYDFDDTHSLTGYYTYDFKTTGAKNFETKTISRYFGLRYSYQEQLSVKVEHLRDQNGRNDYLTQVAYFFN